tara:strand:- start:293 stop:1030 length:738 start_codon:yes stop_codon:yes gene_type:complete
MYNLMVVFNSSYFPFGKVWINSLYEKNDMSRVNRVFIVDTGLEEYQKEYFRSKGDEVYIYDTGLDTDFNDGGAWGKGWQENVGSKTIVFKHILESTNIPLMMVDGDCIFTKDLSTLIDGMCDIQLCKRDAGTPYLGSFVIGQPREQTLDFMDKWIERIATKPTNVPRESPSLSEVAVEEKSNLSIGNIDRLLVSTHNENEYGEHTHIIHLKSATVDRKIDTRLRKYLIESPNFGNLIEKYSNFDD